MNGILRVTPLLFAFGCGATSQLRWQEMPPLASFRSGIELESSLPDLIAQSPFGSLVVVGNDVYGNPCENTVGTTGETGAVGVDGETGALGVEGKTGSVAVEGETGTLGVEGQIEALGVEGEIGALGVEGETGAPGVEGETGASGVQGNTGADGVQGQADLIRCARDLDRGGYVLRLLPPATVFVYDGVELRRVPDSRIYR